MNDTDSTRKWFCVECTALLGIRQGDQVNIRFKQEVNLTARGEVILICRRCGIEEEIQALHVEVGRMTGRRRDAIQRLEQDLRTVQQEIADMDSRIKELEKAKAMERNDNERTN